MLRQWKRSLIYFFICILFMSGTYATYVKADDVAKRAVARKAKKDRCC